MAKVKEIKDVMAVSYTHSPSRDFSGKQFKVWTKEFKKPVSSNYAIGYVRKMGGYDAKWQLKRGK